MTDDLTPHLTLDRVLPPLDCYVVDCDYIWLAETRRYLELRRDCCPQYFMNAAEVRFEDCPMGPDLIRHVSSGSFVVLNVPSSRIDVMLPQIHGLYRKNVLVAVVGKSDLLAYSIAFQAAGTVAVVTNIFGCDKLAGIINRAADLKPRITTGWRTRFVSRLPWNPVQGSDC